MTSFFLLPSVSNTEQLEADEVVAAGAAAETVAGVAGVAANVGRQGRKAGRCELSRPCTHYSLQQRQRQGR